MITRRNWLIYGLLLAIWALILAWQVAEHQRVTKRREELKKQQTSLQARLANDAYSKKAPPHLVQQTRDQLAEVEAELTKLSV